MAHCRSLVTSVMIGFAIFSSANANGRTFEVSECIREAYHLILDLRMQEAQVTLRECHKADPNNLMVPFLEDYLDLITLFVTEDREQYHALKQNRSKRLHLLESGPEDSPWYRYTRAEVYLHWGVLRYRFGEHFAAAADFNRGFRLLDRNAAEFPDFLPTYKSLGLMRMAVGTIPDQYMWAVRLFSSMDGDIVRGKRDLERCLASKQEDNLVLREAQYLYAQGLLHFMNDAEGGWEYLQDIELVPQTNELHCFMLGNMAMKVGLNDTALWILEHQPSDQEVLQIAFNDHMLGKARLSKGLTGAAESFKSYLDAYAGDSFVKEAYQKLAWDRLLKGDVDGYRKYMESCLQLGSDDIGADKNALREARSGEVQNRSLLRARVQFDGGYFDACRETLDGIEIAKLKPEHVLEYEYRLGRLLHETDQLDDAIRQYDKTIGIGIDSPAYYACNAALQAGLIKEARGDLRRAKAYFELCLDMDPEDFRNSLHQKAKAGMLRIEAMQ